MEWRPHSEFPGYEVSDRGAVRRAGRVLKPWEKRPGGHLIVGLMRAGKQHKRYVHRLVLEVFQGPRPPGQECLHRNGNPKDNRWPENIRWGSSAENARDRVRHGRLPKGEAHHKAKLAAHQVRAVRLAKANGVPLRSIAAHYGVSYGAIQAITAGKHWRHVA